MSKMINKYSFANLRNPEYYQFMFSVRDILAKYDIVLDNFGLQCLCDLLSENLHIAESALLAEKRNEKVREKNEADRYRDRLHRKLFNYLKSILYDEKDLRFDDAQEIMRIVREAGNPTRLPENAQSAMMSALGAKLEPLNSSLESIGAKTIVDEMMEANRQFIALEAEYRKMITAQQLDETPASMTLVRRVIDPIYRSIVAAINGYANVPSKKDECRELVAELNVLIARYEALLAARKREKKEKHPTCEECGS